MQQIIIKYITKLNKRTEMRTRIFICIFFVSSLFTAFSQAPYKNSIGGILGFTQGFSYKTFPVEDFAFQVDFGFRWSHYALGLDVNANLMYEKPIQNGFYWFIGGGLSLGPAFGGIVYDNNSTFGFRIGANAIGGAEYKFPQIPLTLQADIRPGISFFVGNGFFHPRFDYSFLNLSARYTF